VFFWANEGRARGLAAAKANRGQKVVLLSVDTLSLARAHAAEVELAPINSGNTRRKPARRGLNTFTQLGAHDYNSWGRLRQKKTPDKIVEVVVNGGPVLVTEHKLKVEPITGG
jgi:mannose/fructose/N-acetylgalactosamine-specific phosphotransferase system component IIB